MNDELMHIGVKGRSGRYRWGSGKRPFQRLEGTIGFNRKKQKKLLKETKKVRIKDVSDEDLQKRINRLNLENSYYDAMKKYRANTKKESKVKKAVSDILADSAKTIAKELVGAYSRQLGKELFPGGAQSKSEKEKK